MIYKVFLLILIVCGLISSCSVEPTLNVDDLIEKNITARGGYEKLKAVKSLEISAKLTQHGKEIPITLKIKRPNLVRVEIFFPGQHSSGAYDGKTAWWIKRSLPRSAPQAVSEEEALIFTRYADFGGLFIDYKKKGKTFELMGIEKIAGNKAYKLKTSFTKDITRFIFLDANSFLIVKESFLCKNRPGSRIDNHYKDYRKVNGVLYPFFHGTTFEGMPPNHSVLDKIETNVDLDDSIFKMKKTGRKEKLGVAGFAKELDDYLKSSTEKDTFSGVVLVSKDGKPIFKKAYGMADRERNLLNKVNTKFCIGSCNKMFTAVAVAQLVEQGKLSYDDFAGKYLGADWMLPEVGKQVKISHLLTHTSGIDEYLTDELWYASADVYRTLEDHKPLVKDKSFIFKPGTKWSYCNGNFIYLGAIIEKVSGEKYNKYIKKHIYQPAGMNDTLIFNLDRNLPNVAMSYEKVKKDGKSSWKKTAYAGKISGSSAGGGYSTVEDLLKFETALRLNTLMSRKSRELHMTVKAGAGNLNYGYGFLIYKSSEMGWVVGHGGTAPGVSANLRMFIDKGYAMIILSNFSMASLPVCGVIKDLIPLLD